jgi:hypothetical protein
MAAEAFYFLLDEKVTKNQVRKEALPHRPLPGKTDKTTGCIICPPASLAQGLTHLGKRRYALPAAQPYLFYQFPSEAFFADAFCITPSCSITPKY